MENPVSMGMVGSRDHSFQEPKYMRTSSMPASLSATMVFEARGVTLGNEEGDVVRVLGGVQAGEQVVTRGSFALKSQIERHKIEPTQ